VAIPLAALLVRSPLALTYATAVVAAYILLNLFNAGYVHMWVNGKAIEMGRGLMAYTLTFRAGELLLIALTRSPLAIAAAAITGYATALFAYGNAAYGCYPLLKFRSQEECEDACTRRYGECIRRCYGKEGEERWECDSPCNQANSDCLNRCSEAFWYMH